MTPEYSIIIPTLNEETNIRRCIENVAEVFPGHEVIIADGGSTDKTVSVAKELGAKISEVAAGRGNQLNMGAAESSGDILLFLHADTLLPRNAKDLIQKSFNDSRTNIATFSISFDITNRVLKFYSLFTKFDSVFTNFGDNCIVVRRDFFYTLGKFPVWSIFEDVGFLQKARRKSKVKILPADVTTSARRFIRVGNFRCQILNSWYMFLFFLGISPEKLRKKYNSMKDVRENAVIIFARYPEIGKVKTRLAKNIGSKFALNFYKTCAEHTFKESMKLSSKKTLKFLFYSDARNERKILRWVGNKFLISAQQGDDLGDRMRNAFNKVFSTGVKKVIIIGTDAPDISSKILLEALNALDESDAVIGPANDGGYYLLGLKNMNDKIFSGIRWSTHKVFELTVEKMRAAGMSVRILDELMDVDTEEDLKNWMLGKSKQKVHPVRTFIKGAKLKFNDV